MSVLGRWASVICSDATEEPVDLSYELVEAVNDALPTGYAVGRLSIAPAADLRGAVAENERLRQVIMLARDRLDVLPISPRLIIARDALDAALDGGQ